MTTGKTLREDTDKRFKALESEYKDNWEAHHKDISKYMLTRKGRYLDKDTTPNDGKRRNEYVIDNTAGRAVNVLAAGMQGGLTSPARPSFRLGLPDTALLEFGPVKAWVEEVRKRMMYVFSKSNFYNVVHGVYAELGAFGTAAMLIEDDLEKIINCVPFTIGEYFIALDRSYRADTLYRTCWKTTGNLVKEFGKENVSDSVKKLVEEGQVDKWVRVVHAIEPNDNRQTGKLNSGNKPWRSVYYEHGQSGQELLRKSGYDMFPVMAPRWDVTGSEVYGRSPGMDVLPDTMMLQKMQEDSLEALDKVVRPPMNAPQSMKHTGGGTIISGGVNYIDVMQGSQGFTPTYQISPDINAMEAKIFNTQTAIKEGLFNDLFLMLAQSSGPQMTATEVVERHEEKMLMIGPVIERIMPELLDPAVDRVYDLMFRKGLIPPPPQELQGMDLQVEYISVLAQAQKLVGLTSIEQLAGYVGNISAVKPEVVDKIDWDASVEEYADMIGAPARLVVPDDAVDEIRDARAEQIAQANAQEATTQAAANAKVLSETDTGTNNALTALTGEAGL